MWYLYSCNTDWAVFRKPIQVPLNTTLQANPYQFSSCSNPFSWVAKDFSIILSSRMNWERERSSVIIRRLGLPNRPFFAQPCVILVTLFKPSWICDLETALVNQFHRNIWFRWTWKYTCLMTKNQLFWCAFFTSSCSQLAYLQWDWKKTH